MDAPAVPEPGVFGGCFRYSRQYRVIVCVECRTAVVPEHAAAHLARNHDRTTKEERKRIQRYVDDLGDLARQVSDVRFPGPDDPPYGEIVVRYGGLWCLGRDTDGRRCGYVVESTQMIQAHCKAAHGWQNEQKRGGNMKKKRVQTANRMWEEGQAYQQFFTKPSWKKNTPVTVPAVVAGGGGTGGGTGTGRDAVELIDRLLTQRETDDSRRRQRQTIQGEGGR
jgi:hypothetical protein